MEFDEDLMIPDKRLSISEGAITVMGWQSCTDKKSFTYAILDALSKEYDFSLDTPFQDYPQEIHDVIIRGTNSREVKVHYKASAEKVSMMLHLRTDPQCRTQIPGDFI